MAARLRLTSTMSTPSTHVLLKRCRPAKHRPRECHRIKSAIHRRVQYLIDNFEHSETLVLFFTRGFHGDGDGATFSMVA